VTFYRHSRVSVYRSVYSEVTVDEDGYQLPELAPVGAEHIRRYQETGGEIGYRWNRVPAQSPGERDRLWKIMTGI
jgi:hypothetical protein